MKSLYKTLIVLILVLLRTQSIYPQWVQTNGPYGGSAECLAVSGTNIFAGTLGGGIFLSTNNGTNWTQIGLVNTYVRSLVVSGTNIFAGTDNGGVFFSTNNGTNWIQTGLTNTFVYALAVSGTDIFAGTTDGVFLFTNNGTNWVQLNNGLIFNSGVQALAVSGNNIFAGTNVGVFLSTNNGTNWTQTDPAVNLVNALTVSGKNILAGTADAGVFLSTNNGSNWTPTALTGAWVNTLAVSGNNIFAGTYYGQGVFLSTNNGTNWASVGLTNIFSVTSLAVSGNNIFAGGDGVYLSTNNGTNWNLVINGLINTYAYSLAVSGNNIFAGADNGVFLSTNNGTNWTQTDFNGFSVAAFTISGNNIFAGGIGVYLSTNNGTNWTQIGLTSIEVSSLAISGTNIFAGTYSGGVFLSTNNGANWKQVNNDLTDTLVYALDIIGTNIFAGTQGGGVFLSTNNGTNWAQVGLNNITVNSFTVNGTKIFAGTNEGVFLSTNNGTNWTQVNNGLPGFNNIKTLTISGNNIFAGGDGVYLSTNNGTNWTQVGLNGFIVNALTVSGNNIFAGTGGAGVWMGPLSLGNYFIMDGNVDSAAVKVATNKGMDLYCGWNGSDLYVATQSAPSTGNDVFIFVSDSLRPLIAAPWAKSGNVAMWSAFLCNESTNNYNAWTGGTGNSQHYSGNFLEGSLNIQSQFGYIPKKIYICTASYQTMDQGTLTNQVPAGNGDGNIDTAEFYQYGYAVTAIELNNFPTYNFELIQNYPNPFNPSTVIGYKVAESGLVTLKVFDILGREVAELVNEMKSPGIYHVIFNAGKLSSGAYFYSLKAGKEVVQKKMMLIK